MVFIIIITIIIIITLLGVGGAAVHGRGVSPYPRRVVSRASPSDARHR